jgi:phosphoglycolate phosphatase-like HAD superfamily hydrolase
VSEADIHTWHGAQKIEVISHFVRQRKTKVDPAALIAVIDKDFQERLASAYFSKDSGITLIDPALPEFFATVRTRGIKVALNTGYPRTIQRGLIDTLGLGKMVCYISTQL